MAAKTLQRMTTPSGQRLALAVAVVISTGVAGYGLYRWSVLEPALPLQVSLPGRDGKPKDGAGQTKQIDLSGTFKQSDGVPADLPGAWPRFRGPNFDNIVQQDLRLATSWDEAGPKALWSADLGEGHAAAAVLHGRVYVIDYDETARADAIRCFSLADGREIWRRSYPMIVKRNHGMSRTIPAVTDDFLVTIGPRCHVVCLDPKSGDFKWGISLVDQFGATEPLWYTGQCPLIDDGKVILAPGGPDALLMAVECATGNVIWTTPNPHGWKMSHSSVMPMTFAGKRMYVYCAIGGVTGVSAEAHDAGQTLWEVPWNAEVIAASPVPLEDGRIFMTAGYGAGGMMFRVTETGGGFSAELLYRHRPAEGFACEQQTPIYHDGLLYGIMPKDAGALRGQFVCYRPDGSLVWSSGQANRFGLGPFLLANGKFYVLSDDGTLTVIEASRERYVQLGRAKVLDGQDAWGPIALAANRMIIRDSKRMVCIDVSAGDGT